MEKGGDVVFETKPLFGDGNYLNELSIILNNSMNSSKRDELGTVLGVGNKHMGTNKLGGDGERIERDILGDKDRSFLFGDCCEEVWVGF